jgi:hypothetical protein
MDLGILKRAYSSASKGSSCDVKYVPSGISGGMINYLSIDIGSSYLKLWQEIDSRTALRAGNSS